MKQCPPFQRTNERMTVEAQHTVDLHVMLVCDDVNGGGLLLWREKEGETRYAWHP